MLLLRPKGYNKMSDEQLVKTALEILEEVDKISLCICIYTCYNTQPDVIADTEQPSLLIPTDEQPDSSCDSSPLIAGSEEQMGHDEFTRYELPTV